MAATTGTPFDTGEREPVFEQTHLFEQSRLQLARLHASEGASLREVWLQLARLVTTALGVDRIGVWVLVDEDRTLRCRYLFQRSNSELFQGAVLHANDFPEYFAAIQTRRSLPADDAETSALTSELSESYLRPLGITSMLDAPIYVQGKVVGVVCHEHVGPPRPWTGAEADFASAVADNIARLYQEYERGHAQTALRSYERHLMELHRMEAIGRMAAGVAHDFRGILGAAMGYAELMRRIPDLPPDADRYAQRIIETLQRGNRLTQEVMSFGKETPVAPRVIDVRGALESLEGMFRVLLGHLVRLRFDIDRRVSRIFMDPTQ
ncbi:MAG TPA: GAF domain-containing protein, partial [Povalibacter sp.]